ncbi:hypothetical protein EI77_02473 [Prosthecobacter fusiformis]|uniref:Uncharacterized protein n=1 Tax=Prosthecobacter fusiformis TaxID=48464 RepID=A0A4R7S0Z7_9BACT|nr:hypothetical protein [Prosthecobacter fusiformis]TDU71349.1 hypothetical protein EI77_02473 [Prosthecobacter fusiformis]
MCCFSKEVREVKNTRIFGRVGPQGNQVLIYQMAIHADQEVAMVLPIPVKSGQGENAVSFFDLQGYPSLFEDLDKGFPAITYGAGPFGSAPRSLPGTLAVISVGAFVASYVPSIADFSRLDERFRLPADVWPSLPGYHHFGFAVFKLKPGHSKIQPMAFSFPSARPKDIFFPTLHIHDGKIHEKELFDHTLYCQANGQDLSRWEESPRQAVSFAKCGLTHGMIQPAQHVYRQILTGRRINADIVVKPRAL